MATRLANAHGVSRAAAAAGLDYYRLKKRAGVAAGDPACEQPGVRRATGTGPLPLKPCRLEARQRSSGAIPCSSNWSATTRSTSKPSRARFCRTPCDAPDHTPDEDPGRRRAGRFSPWDRRPGPTLPGGGSSTTRSPACPYFVFRNRKATALKVLMRRPRGSLGSATSSFPRAASRGPRPLTAALHNAWPLISWRSCSRPATRRGRVRQPTGSRWGRRPNTALTGSCTIIPPLDYHQARWGGRALARRWPAKRRLLGSPVAAGCEPRRSSSKWTATDWRKSSAASSNRSTGRTPAVRSSSRTPTCPTWWKTRTPRFAGCARLFMGHVPEKTEAVVGAKSGKNKTASVCDDAAADGSSADDDEASGALERFDSAARCSVTAATTPDRLRRCRAGPGGAPDIACRRRLPRLRRGDRVREGPGRAGAGSSAGRRCPRRFISCRSAAACPARSSLRRHPRRGRSKEVRRHRRQHDRAS